MNETEQKTLRVQWAQVWASILGPVFAVVGGLLVAWATIRGDLEAQTRAQREQTRVEREQLLAQSGEVLCEGFPFPTSDGADSLPSDFDLFLSDYCAERVERPPSLPAQRELIQQLVDHPEQRVLILAMWRAIYEVEGWIDEIERVTAGG